MILFIPPSVMERLCASPQTSHCDGEVVCFTSDLRASVVESLRAPPQISYCDGEVVCSISDLTASVMERLCASPQTPEPLCWKGYVLHLRPHIVMERLCPSPQTSHCDGEVVCFTSDLTL